MKRFVRAVAVLLAVLLAAGAAGVLWLRSSGRPARDGEHPLAGLDAAVTVRWDRWGVPHVRAESETDLAAALGWLHANDRFTQMELGRRAAYGRLSEIYGDVTLDIDVYFRTLRLGRTADALDRQAGPRSRRWLDAYTRGVNAWLSERGHDLPPGLRLLGVDPEPWQPAHSLAFALLMARDLSFWNERPEEERFRWLAAFGPEGVRELVGDPGLHVPEELVAWGSRQEGGALPPDSGDTGGDIGDAPGSNNWAVAPARTAAGSAILANDPHLGLHLPAVWYEVQLRAPGFEVAGMSLPGTPGVVLGRGPHLAWAFTNTMLDDHDVFFEVLDAEGRNVRRGDGWAPVTVETESVGIRGGESRPLELRSTDRGPLLDADPERGLPARSLAWTAYFDADPVAALLDLSQAATPDDVLAAIEPFVCPAQNLVVAFADGRLLFTVLGGIPQRRAGDGRLPSPGWNPGYGWDGLRPRASNPVVVDPPDGFLVTANDDVQPAGYAPRFSADFFLGYRAQRIREALAGRSDWSREAVAGLQTDVVSLQAREVVAALGVAPSAMATDAAGAAWQALAAWDGTMDLHGPSAYYILLQRELLHGTFDDEAAAHHLASLGTRDTLTRLLRGEMRDVWFDDVSTPETESRGDVVARALAAAWQDGLARWGPDLARWDYGDVHRLTLRHRLDAVPGFGWWARRGPFPMPGSASTVAAFGARWRGDRQEVTYGPSMRWIVDWSDPRRSWAVVPGGQSGHPADPHYDDQIEPYVRGELHPSPWSEEAVHEATVSEMVLRVPPATMLQTVRNHPSPD